MGARSREQKEVIPQVVWERIGERVVIRDGVTVTKASYRTHWSPKDDNLKQLTCAEVKISLNLLTFREQNESRGEVEQAFSDHETEVTRRQLQLFVC